VRAFTVINCIILQKMDWSECAKQLTLYKVYSFQLLRGPSGYWYMVLVRAKPLFQADDGLNLDKHIFGESCYLNRGPRGSVLAEEIFVDFIDNFKVAHGF